MARIASFLIAALLLLISTATTASASAVHASCDLEKDWPPYKVGTHHLFPLPELTPAMFYAYQSHCDVRLYGFSIYVTGTLDKNLLNILTSLQDALRSDSIFQKRVAAASWGIMVYLNSGGGDVNVAMKIGRVLRDLQARIAINGFDGECASSCVFVLAGGVSREIVGRVGVHRPYFGELSAKRTSTEVSQAYAQQRALIAQYLKDMNPHSPD